jgi:hypothetical protein
MLASMLSDSEKNTKYTKEKEGHEGGISGGE